MGIARRKIDREAVLDAALAVADRKSLRGVSVRSIAAEAGIAPMSIYTHVHSKEQLLDRMLERVARLLLAPTGKATWRDDLEATALHARRLLLAHPNWIPLLARHCVPPFSLAIYDRLLGLMKKDGFTPDNAMLAVSAVMSFALGSVLVERSMSVAHEPIPRRQLIFARTRLSTSLPAYLNVERRQPSSTDGASITCSRPDFGRWSSGFVRTRRGAHRPGDPASLRVLGDAGPRASENDRSA
jgi:AcrR family transcriptional regulator